MKLDLEGILEKVAGLEEPKAPVLADAYKVQATVRLNDIDRVVRSFISDYGGMLKGVLKSHWDPFMEQAKEIIDQQPEYEG